MQDDGRWSCGPVHCPLLPAPLPGAGGGGSAHAGAVTASASSAPTVKVAALCRIRTSFSSNRRRRRDPNALLASDRCEHVIHSAREEVVAETPAAGHPAA